MKIQQIHVPFSRCSDYTAVRCYVIYCTVIVCFILHSAIIHPQNEKIRKEFSQKIMVLDQDQRHSLLGTTSTTICCKLVNVKSSFSNDRDDTKNTLISDQRYESKDINKGSHVKKVVVIGFDSMSHVQTNNHINAILHAMDYAADIQAKLVLFRKGWPTKALKLLFKHKYGNNYDDMTVWEKSIEKYLNVDIVQDAVEINELYPDIETFYNNSDDMYYYHTNATIDTIKKRRQPILEYLWTHPTRNPQMNNQHVGKDMCAVVEYASAASLHTRSSIIDTSTPAPKPAPYTVVHSRWMKNNGCLNRMGGLAQRIQKHKPEWKLDRKAPCLLQPDYIKSIVTKCGTLGKPIYIITDGLNPQITQDLQSHPGIGQDVQIIPEDVSWVGGDMMLGVLSDCFIGNPVSTLSGNIARARVALGKDSSTNFLFPFTESKRKSDTDLQFFCQDSPDCLYDEGVLHHYVG
mmetsp:Transcript_25267/g.31133  ORF Transcript_25267/g.31133 Transcript_25267/m.31133 type:complete len:461 (+) Transcript_25267:139-1521(+)